MAFPLISGTELGPVTCAMGGPRWGGHSDGAAADLCAVPGTVKRRAHLTALACIRRHR